MPDDNAKITIPGTKVKISRKAAIIGGVVIIGVAVFLIVRARAGSSGSGESASDETADSGMDSGMGSGGGGTDTTSPGEVLGWDTTQPPSEISAPGDMYTPPELVESLEPGYTPQVETTPVSEAVVAEIGDVGAGGGYYAPSNIAGLASMGAKDRAAQVAKRPATTAPATKTPAKKAAKVQPKVAAAKAKPAPAKKAQPVKTKPVKGKSAGKGKRG